VSGQPSAIRFEVLEYGIKMEGRIRKRVKERGVFPLSPLIISSGAEHLLF
jgi:hypothetical protein